MYLWANSALIVFRSHFINFVINSQPKMIECAVVYEQINNQNSFLCTHLLNMLLIF